MSIAMNKIIINNAFKSFLTVKSGLSDMLV